MINIEEIITKYNLKRNSYVDSELISKEEYELWLRNFTGRWRDRFEPGDYIIDLTILPKIWYYAIDELFDILIKECPEFRLAQIKIKVGGIRIHVKNISNDVFWAIDAFEQLLYDDKFVY